MPNDKNNILIAVPVYNEQDQLGRVLNELVRHFPSGDMVVVNDGSTDATQRIIRSFAVASIEHKKNSGKGAAILSAIRYAKKKGYRWIILLDGDGQHAVHEIHDFIGEIVKNKSDVILGNRVLRTGIMPLPRIMSNGISSIIVSLCAGRQRIHDSQCGFRAIRVACIEPDKYKCKGFQFESEILLRLGKSGCRFQEMPVSTIYENSKSEMKLLEDTLKFIILIFDSFTW